MDDNSPVAAGEWHKGQNLDDLNFRGGDHGRFLWTVDGVEYARYYLPPTLPELASTPQMMVAQMDYVGVGRAVIGTGHVYGRLNEFIASAMMGLPDRFWGLAVVDEWLADQPGQISELDRAIHELGLHGLYFDAAGLSRRNGPEKLDDPLFYPFWDHVRELGIPVFWNITNSGSGREFYLSEHAAFGRWVERYPEVTAVYTHGLALYRLMEDGKLSIPDDVWKPLQAPNVLTEVLIPILMGGVWEYPFVEARQIIRQYFEKLGPDSLIWGSDMPNVERYCTYRQSLDYLRLHCDFIPEADMAKICGENVAGMFGGIGNRST